METTKSSQSVHVSDLKYQGRKTSRANSEQRRRCILEAALRIVVRDGIRGVRHRAVAKEAEVPLSATTYYFKDISDLITDAFTLFVEMGAETFHAFWEKVASRLEDTAGAEGGGRKRLAEHLTELVFGYVQSQLQEHQDYLIIERSFHLECIRNSNLKPVAFRHQSYLLESLGRFFGRLGSPEPRLDARLLTAIIMQVEYDGLVGGEEGRMEKIKSMLARQIQLMLNNSA